MLSTLFSDMSLATLRLASASSREAGIVLHDLQLDFCQQQADEKKKNVSVARPTPEWVRSSLQ